MLNDIVNMQDQAPIRKRISERLAGLPAELRPIRDSAQRYLDHRCAMRGNEGDYVEIAHSPWIGALGFAFRIYPGTNADVISRYQQLHGIVIPSVWQPVLLAANGLEAFGLTLFGMPASMLNDPPLLNRATFQCLDIGLANSQWKFEYAKIKPDYFHVGARDYSYDELVGYFITTKGSILGIRQNGQRVGEWATIDQFLSEELKAAESLFLDDAPKDWQPNPH